MNILNYYFTSTGNTEKVALRIHNTSEKLGHSVKTLRVTSGDMDINVLKYDFVFAGSGVYSQFPGQSLIGLHRILLQKHIEKGDIKYAAPRR